MRILERGRRCALGIGDRVLARTEERGQGFIAHPTAEAVAQLDYDDLTKLQYSRRKAEYLIDTARLITAALASLPTPA